MRVLNRVARKCGLQPVADNAARAKVESLAADVLARDLLPADVEAVNNSMQKYQATFEAAVPNPEGPPQPVASPTTYKFQAVQLTYNSSAAAFVSQDWVELEALFERFKVFLASLRASLSVIGVSATMERASPERVHLHAYLHLSKPFHRRGADALDMFKFEGSFASRGAQQGIWEGLHWCCEVLATSTWFVTRKAPCFLAVTWEKCRTKILKGLRGVIGWL